MTLETLNSAPLVQSLYLEELVLVTPGVSQAEYKQENEAKALLHQRTLVQCPQ